MTNQNLKELRETKGLSQSAFAELLGVSQPAISNAESKPELRVSNRIYSKLKNVIGADQDNNNNNNNIEIDPEIKLNFSIKLKKSQLNEIQSSKAPVDLTHFFTII